MPRFHVDVTHAVDQDAPLVAVFQRLEQEENFGQRVHRVTGHGNLNHHFSTPHDTRAAPAQPVLHAVVAAAGLDHI